MEPINLILMLLPVALGIVFVLGLWLGIKIATLRWEGNAKNNRGRGPYKVVTLDFYCRDLVWHEYCNYLNERRGLDEN